MKPKDYKENEFIHFISRRTGEVIQNNTKTRKIAVKEMHEIPFSDIEKINLENRGATIPFTKDNVVNLDRYMLKYWSPIIGGDAIMLWLHLWEYCRDGATLCWPKIEKLAEMLGKSKPTVNKLIKKLEENNFLICIHRLNKETKNRETSPLFKLRQTIPLISKEQYSTLSDSLKKKHKEFMDNFAGDRTMEHFKYDYESTKEALYMNSDKIITKKARQKIDKMIQEDEATTFLIEKLSAKKLKYNDIIKDNLMQMMSKPAYETFYGNTLFIYQEEITTVELVFANEIGYSFHYENIETLQERLDKAIYNSLGREDFAVKRYRIKNYIMNMMKEEEGQ